MPWTTPHTFVALEVPTAAEWNATVSDNLQFLYDRTRTARARLYHSGTQTIGTSAITPINFVAEEYDTASLHDAATNNTRITIPSGYDGLWAFGGGIPWAANSTGRRATLVRLNGTTPICQQEAGVVDATLFVQSLAGERQFAAGDYIELCGFQSSGGNLNMDGSVSVNCFFWASYRGNT